VGKDCTSGFFDGGGSDNGRLVTDLKTVIFGKRGDVFFEV
jgi:hypothetical protein